MATRPLSPKDIRAAGSEAASSTPTIRDVARVAGVSISTVSNVLNNRATMYRDATKRRVLKAIEQLGYRPQTAGRELRTSSRRMVALIVVDESESYLLDPFVANVVVGFTQECDRRGYLAVLHGGASRSIDEMVVLNQISVDGYCLMLSGTKVERRMLMERVLGLQLPVVAVQEFDHALQGDVCVVRQDDFDGGRQICEHLLARNVSHILTVTPQQEWPALAARMKGIQEAADRSRRTIRLQTVVSRSEMLEDVSASIAAYLDNHEAPDAIIGANDQMALAVVNVLRQRRLRVPADVLVTGFNAFEFWRYIAPSLTTVTSPARELGTQSATALIERIEAGAFAQREVVLPVRLLLGEST